MNVLEQLSGLLADLLREDPRRVLLGEDVQDGGMLGLSKLASEDERLRSRLLSTPLTSNAAAAHAGGLALAGLRPIVLLPCASALIEALPALREVARAGWRSGGQREAPVLFVAPTGPGFGLGGDAATSPEHLLAAIPDLRLRSIALPQDAMPRLRAAAADQEHIGPTVLLLPRALIGLEPGAKPDANDADADLPLRSRRTGNTATVFTWGAALEPSLRAADASPHEISVVELCTLSPLDEEGLVAAAKQNGKLIIAHAGPRRHGIGAELAAIFADAAILHLDAPITRVCGTNEPHTRHDEWHAIPSAEAIAEAIARVAEY